MNRVVITGYGVASPIGNEPETFLESSRAGKDGIGPTNKFDISKTSVTLAVEAKDFPMKKYFVKKGGKRMDKFSLFGIYATLEAVAMSGLDTSRLSVGRFSVMVGSGIGGSETIQNQVTRMHDRGPERVASLFISMAIGNIVVGNIALRVGAKGIYAPTATTCASATHLTGGTFRSIRHGYSDVVIADKAEVPTTGIGISRSAFLTALTKATDPEKASTPFDKERSGLVIGEGVGVFILGSLDHALERSAAILSGVVGYDANCDVYHTTSPAPDGSDAAKVMVLAAEEAGISPGKTGYANAHGTSTQASNSVGSKVVELTLGDAVKAAYVSSTRSITGYPLGVAGGIEGVATLNALQHQFIPPTISVENQGEAITVNAVLNESKEHKFDYTLNSSLGLGGHNAAICLKRQED